MLRRLAFFLLAAAAPLVAQTYQGQTLVTPSLVANTSAIVPGKPFQVALQLDTASTWHTYWEYPGDAGVPTQLNWTLPPGFTASPIQWPLPQRVMEPGDIEVYAYSDKTVLLATITPPAQINEKSITLHANATWLVCAEICIPGKGQVELTLPVSAQAEAANAALFDRTRNELPSGDVPPYPLTWKRDGKNISVTATGLNGVKAIDLFPLPADGQQVGHPTSTLITNGSSTVSVEAPGDLNGVLVVDAIDGRKGWFVSSSAVAAPAAPMVAVAVAPASRPGIPAGPGLWMALLYGFLGGLILNLMPCVLPVISLKIFGFINQAGSHPERIFRHGLAFVGGIFAWFLALGLLIVGLKAAGHEVTWAFQFQNPWFNLALCSIVFVFALNLFGVFEIILPGRANNALAQASEGEGYTGSFFQGVFATLLATPCTAPFLGAALGFAFSQSGWVIMSIFASVALGMSAPYCLLSAQPGWMKILPKPGAWMERVKQLMGFPLLATLIWLLFILGGQKGLDGVIWTLAFLLCLALGCWIYGAISGPLNRGRARLLGFLAILLIVGWGGWYCIGGKFIQAETATAQARHGGISWVPFSEKALADLLDQGKPVFVDFTADWCISCKFNERTALDVSAVREALRKESITAMRADWTNANPEITAALKKFGRVGVPFYVFYPAGKKDAPVVLPELLTTQIVLDALAQKHLPTEGKAPLLEWLAALLIIGWGGWLILRRRKR